MWNDHNTLNEVKLDYLHPTTKHSAQWCSLFFCGHSLLEALHTHASTIQRRSGNAFEPLRQWQREKAPEKVMRRRTVSFCVSCGFWIFLSITVLWVLDINICMHCRWADPEVFFIRSGFENPECVYWVFFFCSQWCFISALNG